MTYHLLISAFYHYEVWRLYFCLGAFTFPTFKYHCLHFHGLYYLGAAGGKKSMLSCLDQKSCSGIFREGMKKPFQLPIMEKNEFDQWLHVSRKYFIPLHFSLSWFPINKTGAQSTILSSDALPAPLSRCHRRGLNGSPCVFEGAGVKLKPQFWFAALCGGRVGQEIGCPEATTSPSTFLLVPLVSLAKRNFQRDGNALLKTINHILYSRLKKGKKP